MTEQENFLAMLDRATVPYRLEGNGTDDGTVGCVLEMVVSRPTSILDALQGYPGFVTVFEFDRQGALFRVGLWE